MTRLCESCSAALDPRLEEWKRLCLSCWRGKKRRQEGTYAMPAPAEMQARLALAESRLAVANAEIDELSAKLDEQANRELDRAMLRRLIHLCHPDKDGGSQVAHRATDFLLKLKRRSNA